MSTKPYSTLTLYRRLLADARPYGGLVLAYFLVRLLGIPLALLAPLPLKVAVDNVLGSRPLPPSVGWAVPAWAAAEHLVVVAAGLVLLVALLTHAQALAAALLRTYVGERLVTRFRARLFRHVQRLSLAYHDARGTADSVYRIQYDAPAIEAVVLDGAIPLVTSLAMLGAMLYVTALVSPRLALVAVAVVPVLLLLTALFGGRLRRQWREVKKHESSAQSVVQETLGAVRVVKAFNREDREHARFVATARTGLAAKLRAGAQENCYALLVGLTTAAGTAAVLYLGVREVRAGAGGPGTLTLGGLLLVMAYLGKLYEPIKTLGKQLTTKQKSLASAERAFALLDELPDVPDKPDARPLARAAGAVSFRNVSFGYGVGGDPVLTDVSFDVPAGGRVGIVGRTGAGKTTLVNLLSRLYDPDQGQILLDGVDLRDYRLADLRNQFSVVLQDAVLFSTSIAENVAYGRAEAGRAEVAAAAAAAGADKFIAALPDGYETPVGERGMRLSGGERQRVSIARAFLRDAPVLILDEPTSSVDTETEAAIMAAMDRLMAGRTVFMIAHRLGTLAGCDVVLRVADGRVEAVRPADLHRPAPARPDVAAEVAVA